MFFLQRGEQWFIPIHGNKQRSVDIQMEIEKNQYCSRTGEAAQFSNLSHAGKRETFSASNLHLYINILHVATV